VGLCLCVRVLGQALENLKKKEESRPLVVKRSARIAIKEVQRVEDERSRVEEVSARGVFLIFE
jgi:hypothetical protein